MKWKKRRGKKHTVPTDGCYSNVGTRAGAGVKDDDSKIFIAKVRN